MHDLLTIKKAGFLYPVLFFSILERDTHAVPKSDNFFTIKTVHFSPPRKKKKKAIIVSCQDCTVSDCIVVNFTDLWCPESSVPDRDFVLSNSE